MLPETPAQFEEKVPILDSNVLPQAIKIAKGGVRNPWRDGWALRVLAEALVEVTV